MYNEIMNGLEYLFVYFILEIVLKMIRVGVICTLFTLHVISLPISYTLVILDWLFKIRGNVE
jgi:hypothetical protein